MPTTKSGIEGPADAPKKKPEAPVKSYPGSGKIGKGCDTSGRGGCIEGPMKNKGGKGE